jgi:hypothetical protein
MTAGPLQTPALWMTASNGVASLSSAATRRTSSRSAKSRSPCLPRGRPARRGQLRALGCGRAPPRRARPRTATPRRGVRARRRNRSPGSGSPAHDRWRRQEGRPIRLRRWGHQAAGRLDDAGTPASVLGCVIGIRPGDHPGDLREGGPVAQEGQQEEVQQLRGDRGGDRPGRLPLRQR